MASSSSPFTIWRGAELSQITLGFLYQVEDFLIHPFPYRSNSSEYPNFMQGSLSLQLCSGPKPKLPFPNSGFYILFIWKEGLSYLIVTFVALVYPSFSPQFFPGLYGFSIFSCELSVLLRSMFVAIYSAFECFVAVDFLENLDAKRVGTFLIFPWHFIEV